MPSDQRLFRAIPRCIPIGSSYVTLFYPIVDFIIGIICLIVVHTLSNFVAPTIAKNTVLVVIVVLGLQGYIQSVSQNPWKLSSAAFSTLKTSMHVSQKGNLMDLNQLCCWLSYKLSMTIRCVTWKICYKYTLRNKCMLMVYNCTHQLLCTLLNWSPGKFMKMRKS